MTAFEVKELGADEYDKWDKLINNSPQGSMFNNSFWLVMCSRALRKKARIYGCFKDGELVGGCPLYVSESSLFSVARSTNSMSPFGGVVVARMQTSKTKKQEDVYRNLVACLTKTFEHLFDSITITNSPDLTDIRPFVWNGWNARVNYTYCFDLDCRLEDSVSKEVRWAARKAVKSNIIVRRWEQPDVSVYHRLLLMTYGRQNLEAPFSVEALDDILKTLRHERAGETWVAESKDGYVTAAEVIVWDAKRAYRWSAVSHSEFRGTGSTSLLLCEILKNLKERGFREINMMAANTPQLARFISGFNPRLVPYYSVDRKTTLVYLAGALNKGMKRAQLGLHLSTTHVPKIQ